jgi:hypothetical protein
VGNNINLDVIFQWALSIFFLMGVMRAFFYILLRRSTSYGLAILIKTTLISIVTAVFWVFLRKRLTPESFGLSADSSDKNIETTDATKAPLSEESIPITNSVSIDWEMVTNNILTLSGLAVIGAIIFGAIKLAKIARKKKAITKTAALRIETIILQASEKLEKVMLSSASYETSLALQIDYPLMTDVTQTPVAKYVQHMRLAISARDALPASPSLDVAQHYLDAVTVFEVSFEAAEEWAQRIKWSTFSVAEVRRLKDAKVSLSLLEDATTSPEQRNALYKRLEKLLSGLITITEPLKLSLSAKVPMLSLEISKV